MERVANGLTQCWHFGFLAAQPLNRRGALIVSFNLSLVSSPTWKIPQLTLAEKSTPLTEPVSSHTKKTRAPGCGTWRLKTLGQHHIIMAEQPNNSNPNLVWKLNTITSWFFIAPSPFSMVYLTNSKQNTSNITINIYIQTTCTWLLTPHSASEVA